MPLQPYQRMLHCRQLRKVLKQRYRRYGMVSFNNPAKGGGQGPPEGRQAVMLAPYDGSVDPVGHKLTPRLLALAMAVEGDGGIAGPEQKGLCSVTHGTVEFFLHLFSEGHADLASHPLVSVYLNEGLSLYDIAAVYWFADKATGLRVSDVGVVRSERMPS